MREDERWKLAPASEEGPQKGVDLQLEYEFGEFFRDFQMV